MKSTITDALLQEVSTAFQFAAPVTITGRYGSGHINDTFLAVTEDGTKYIVQRINTEIFTDPKGLMENICGVTAYLRKQIIAKGGNPERETLNVVPTTDGGNYYTDGEGGAWRVFTFVTDTICLDKVESEEDFCTVGATFGAFMNQLADYPAATLHETIARFHDTPNRYANFEKALAADVMGRAKDIQPEIDFIHAHEADCHHLVDLLAKGDLPLRVTHNDTKLNNVLLDKETGKGICVIDLDTIMPGLSAYDFGDSIRFGANDCDEDEPDQSKVHFSLHLFEVFAKGYLGAAGSVMPQLEKECLPWGAKLMTLECGMRFLTDYLEGDHYFATHRDGQNLDRARTQFTLVKGMEAEWDGMMEVIRQNS